MKLIKLLAVGLALTLTSCESVLDVGDKPDASERSSDFNILFKDNTGSMKEIYGNDIVPGVDIYLKSVTLGTEYKFTSDAAGVVSIKNIISDKYVITAKRMMSSEEMEALTGSAQDYYKLKNSSTGIIDLDAENTDTIHVYLDVLEKSSPLVISEIYACGPPNAGLYFHDKYVEVYNQTDSVLYLDGIMIGDVAGNPSNGVNYRDDPDYLHVARLWKFPGSGKEYPIQPGQSVVCAEDAIDHRISAPESVDLSGANFEFYKDDVPDIDNPNVPNMVKIYQKTSEADWVIGGEKGALCLIEPMNEDSLQWYNDHIIIPYKYVMDGVEYIDDLTDVAHKKMSYSIDASFTGGITFYTGKSMERKTTTEFGRVILKDDNNSMLDFTVLDHPTPGYQH